MSLSIIGETAQGLLIVLREKEIFTLNPNDPSPNPSLKLLLKTSLSPKCKILQASIQDLLQAEKSRKNRQFLIAIVYIEDSLYSAKIILAEQFETSDHKQSTQCFASIVILEELQLVKEESHALRVHIVPSRISEADVNDEDESLICTFRNQVIVLSLELCITVYQVDTLLKSENSKIEIVSSECIPKEFYWAQWIVDQNCLAFVHARKPIDSLSSSSKNLLSIFQFHEKYPREAVLNMPLEEPVPVTTQIPRLCKSANIFCESNHAYQLFAHKSGTIILVQVLAPENVKTSSISYKLNLIHHDKSMTVKIIKKEWIPVQSLHFTLFNNAQYLAVVGYPYFLQLLDVGTLHEPSHHLLIDLAPLYLPKEPVMWTSSEKSNIKLTNYNVEQKLIEINPTMLYPIYKSSNEINMKLSILHYLLVHATDVNCVKRDIHLTGIFQEFIVANTYFTTRKLLMQNLESFLHYLPYSNHAHIYQNYSTVATMLLSPSQRVIPTNVVDLWTSLWEANKLISRATRFDSKNIAEKLIVSFQCYKPEALSRVTTPMSPSSPMVCQSLGDIAAMFGRRQELQLPFAEHESCTANRQEYVYTVNLRELSTHLLKERKEWPVHGQTVAGKYMNSLVDSARLLLHLICLTHFPPTKNRDKGFQLIDSLSPNSQFKTFFLFEHYTLGLGSLAVPLPQGIFDLQIDLVKTIMADFETKQLQLLSLLPKSRSSRILNTWSEPSGIIIKARQHAHDLLTGGRGSIISRKTGRNFNAFQNSRSDMKKYSKKGSASDRQFTPLDTFFDLITAKASECDIDLGLLTEAIMLSINSSTEAQSGTNSTNCAQSKRKVKD